MKGSIRIFALSLIFTVVITNLRAQTQDSYEYQSEFTWGINKNTYGGLIGGLVFKKARKLKDPKWLETYGLELVNVKHPQEVRKTSGTGNFYIHGKQNYLYALRLQYGRDLILFKKAPQQGVEIKAVFAAGPTLGFLAPYYLEYSTGGNELSSYFAQYEPANGDEILGTGRLFQGIGESKFRLGANLKAAINFELGTVKSSVTGFEAGFLLDAYTKEIVLMPTTENYSVFPTLFIAIFYGSRK